MKFDWWDLMEVLSALGSLAAYAAVLAFFAACAFVIAHFVIRFW
jgi:hypothetical protein